MRRTLLTIAVLTAGTAAALAVPAAAGESVGAKLTLRVGDTIESPPLYGRVSSKRQECVEGRRVAIVVPGQGVLDYADKRTNENGKWRFSSQLQGAETFQARVKPVTADGVSCAAAASPVRSL